MWRFTMRNSRILRYLSQRQCPYSRFSADHGNNSGKDLKVFFDQWIYQEWASATFWFVDLRFQNQSSNIPRQDQKTQIFKITVEVGWRDAQGEPMVQTMQLASKNQTFRLSASAKPVEVVLDPNTWLLFEGGIQAK